jgi:hypothetical protein
MSLFSIALSNMIPQKRNNQRIKFLSITAFLAPTTQFPASPFALAALD